MRLSIARNGFVAARGFILCEASFRSSPVQMDELAESVLKVLEFVTEKVKGYICMYNYSNPSVSDDLLRQLS
jgi:hypothetical protein